MDKPLRPCSHPGCPELIRHKGYCAAHNERPGHNQVYDHRWREASAQARALHSWCVLCGRPVQEIHHDIPLTANGPRLDPRNFVPLCTSCHVRITAATRGTPTSRRRSR